VEWGNLLHRARGDFIDDANSILRSFINSIHDTGYYQNIPIGIST
jgi:hypothetical protein